MCNVVKGFMFGKLRMLLSGTLLLLTAVLFSPATNASIPQGGGASWAGLQSIGKGALLPEQVAVTLAEYAGSDNEQITRFLERLGWQEAKPLASKGDLSPAEVLQLAYSASEAEERRSGKFLLTAFIQLVATDVPSIMSEPEVKRFVAQHPTTRTQFLFANKAALLPPSAFDPKLRNVIALVADITATHGSPMYPRLVMERHLRLKRVDVLKAILKYGSGEAALAAVLKKLPNPPQKQRLAEIALQLIDTVPASRSNPVLTEAVFRWLGLSDPKVGEWFKYRERMIEAVEAGKMNAPENQIRNAQQALVRFRQDIPAMIKIYADHGNQVSSHAIERMFFEYINRQPEVAALWSFAVIGMKKNFNDEKYVGERAEKLKQSVEKEFGPDPKPSKGMPVMPDGKIDYLALAREHGPKPYNGFQEYATATGFGTHEAAGRHFDEPAVVRAVAGICPLAPKGAR